MINNGCEFCGTGVDYGRTHGNAAAAAAVSAERGRVRGRERRRIRPAKGACLDERKDFCSMAMVKEHEEALFDAARLLDGSGARDAFLEQACAGNPEARARLSALLSAETQAENFSKTPPPQRSFVLRTPTPVRTGQLPSTWRWARRCRNSSKDLARGSGATNCCN